MSAQQAGWVQAALCSEPWRQRCWWEAPCGLWAVPGPRSEAVCLWMTLTCRDASQLPITGITRDTRLRGRLGTLRPCWEPASPPSPPWGPSAPAVLAALSAYPGGHDSIGHSTASHFLPGAARTRLMVPAARHSRLQRAQVTFPGREPQPGRRGRPPAPLCLQGRARLQRGEGAAEPVNPEPQRQALQGPILHGGSWGPRP